MTMTSPESEISPHVSSYLERITRLSPVPTSSHKDCTTSTVPTMITVAECRFQGLAYTTWCVGIKPQSKSNETPREEMQVSDVTRPRAWWRLSSIHPVSTPPGCRHTCCRRAAAHVRHPRSARLDLGYTARPHVLVVGGAGVDVGAPRVSPCFVLPCLAVERVCYKMGWIVVALFCCCRLVRGTILMSHPEHHELRNDRNGRSLTVLSEWVWEIAAWSVEKAQTASQLRQSAGSVRHTTTKKCKP